MSAARDLKSFRNISEALKSTARGLLKVSLGFSAGAAKPKSASSRRGPQEQLIAWLDLERWLHEQIYMYTDADHRMELDEKEAANGSKRIKMDTVEKEEETLQETITQLRDELYQSEQARSKEELILKRIRENQVLVSAVFGETEGNGVVGPEHRRMQHGIEQRDIKAGEALRLSEELAQVRVDRLAVEEEGRALKTETRELYTRLRSVQDAATSLDLFAGGGGKQSNINLLNELEQEKTKNAILRRVLQSIVIESGINWSQDPELLEFMTRLG